MSRRSILLAAFVAMAATQLAVPAWMIVRRELTLSHGTLFKFRTQPVDPADAFRGRYVQLALEPNRVSVTNAAQWQYNQRAYALISTNQEGFAVVTELRRTPPSAGDAVPVRIGWPDSTKGEVFFSWPMDRFYMEESKAPAAEAAYRASSGRANRTCHVTVRVRSGTAVIEDLFIDGIPVREYLRKK